jgi:hypothetical protein
MMTARIARQIAAIGDMAKAQVALLDKEYWASVMSKVGDAIAEHREAEAKSLAAKAVADAALTEANAAKSAADQRHSDADQRDIDHALALSKLEEERGGIAKATDDLNERIGKLSEDTAMLEAAKKAFEEDMEQRKSALEAEYASLLASARISAEDAKTDRGKAAEELRAAAELRRDFEAKLAVIQSIGSTLSAAQKA